MGVKFMESKQFLLAVIAVGVSFVTLAGNLPSAAVRTWPQPKEMARSADFALTAGGRSVDVLATARPSATCRGRTRS